MKLGNIDKIDQIITLFKNDKFKKVSARDIGKRANMSSVQASSYLKCNGRVKYNGKEWVIL